MRIGIDLGGTKIEAICLTPDGKEIFRKRVPTPQGDYDKTVFSIVELVRKIRKTIGQGGSIGIGIPGKISAATGLIVNANSTWLIDKPLKTDLEGILDQSVRFENDANCFTLSESLDGAAKGANNVFGIILGTGVGGGLFLNGEIVKGLNAIAGEWGHNQQPWLSGNETSGTKCYCGKFDCIETYLNGKALTRLYSGKLLEKEKLTALEIANLADRNQTEAIHAIKVYSNRLARALASIINVIDPEVVVLGGGLSNIKLLYELVPKLWQQWIFSDLIKTKLKKNKFGDSSGVRGAAWLWPIESRES